MHVSPVRPRPLRTLVAALALAIGLLGLSAPAASATNPGTKSGLRTEGCAVSWYAQSDLSLSYTKDYDGDGTISNDEQYANQGYLFEVSSRTTYPAVHGPGDFLLHHWATSNTNLGFRLPIATDHPMHDVTVTIKADTPNFTLTNAVTAMGLAKYVAIDGNPAYKVEAPAPATVTQNGDGTLTLTWPYLPANSANILSFAGTATDGKAMDPASHYTISAALTATYAQGAGCKPTAPALPPVPAEEPCQQVLAGRTAWPVTSPDITARDRFGDGGEVNADGGYDDVSRYLRLYGATDADLSGVTATFTAAQGFTFEVIASAVVTGGASGMGALPGKGYTESVSGAGTPTIDATGKTVTLDIASMPAKSAWAVIVRVKPDGSLKQLVADSTMVGTLVRCTVPQPPATDSTRPAASGTLGPLVQTDLVGDNSTTGLALSGLVLTAAVSAAMRRRVR